MELTTDLIKELRDKTGVSVMQCKKALEEAGGDLAQAEVILRKRSAASAEKKADRVLAAGVIGTYVHDGAIGAMVVLSSETDFVAKNPEFAVLAREVAMQVAATAPLYARTEDIPEDKREAALAVFAKEVEGKPEAMKEQILAGKMASFFRDQVLLESPYIKDEAKTVRDLLNEATQKFGERVEVSAFSRLSVR
ncbi:MAG: elongation factor Ts [Patescibacteria group bacterium]|nr:elongation factor Ts [Patescibacteria group bacterium]MDE1944433.1 elongation factor Ts [Patescibacteria group bacterium]MDE1944687.1 elongation factor Ts [Patescibacteria group bacterium]MDE2057373.1 elongation factor Ts [Patescibacteria group bacterium]